MRKQSGTLIPKSETAKNTLILGDLIKEQYDQAGLSLPTLVFIPRSGLEIAGTLCRHLDIGAASMMMAPVERIDHSNNRSAKQIFRIGQFPTRSQVLNKNLLAVDVVCRSGATLDFVTKRLAKLGAASVKSAVLYDIKPVASDQANRQFTPDYYVEDGRGLGYAIFHWEWEEMVAEGKLEQQDIALQAGSSSC